MTPPPLLVFAVVVWIGSSGENVANRFEDQLFVTTLDVEGLLNSIRPTLRMQKPVGVNSSGVHFRFDSTREKAAIGGRVGVFGSEATARAELRKALTYMQSSPRPMDVSIGNESAFFPDLRKGGQIHFRRWNCVFVLATYTEEWDELLRLAQHLDSSMQTEGQYVHHASSIEEVAFDLKEIRLQYQPRQRVLMPLTFTNLTPSNVVTGVEASHGSGFIERKEDELVFCYLAPPQPGTDEVKITVFVPGFALTTKTYRFTVKQPPESSQRD